MLYILYTLSITETKNCTYSPVIELVNTFGHFGDESFQAINCIGRPTK